MCVADIAVNSSTPICCAEYLHPQQSFLSPELCSQSSELLFASLAIFIIAEIILLFALTWIVMLAPTSKRYTRSILVFLSIVSALIDDAVVYTRFRYTVPSQALLVVWTSFAAAAAANNLLFCVPAIVTLPVLIVVDASRGALVYLAAIFLASRGKRAMEPVFVTFSVLALDSIVTSETGADRVEIYLSVAKICLGTLLLWDLLPFIKLSGEDS